MNLVPKAVSREIARRGLLASKNAPKTLFVAGVAGSIGSTVLACRATLKLSDVLLETQQDLQVARSIEDARYDEKTRQKDVTIIYARSVGKIGRLYAPSVLLGAASIAALTKSHNMLQDRNLALTAAYAAVDRAFQEYRGRVIDEYGEEKDREFRFPTETIDVYDEESGKTEQVSVMSDAAEHSMYARFFDQLSPSWSKEPEYNLVFLRCQQNWANDMLKVRGHLFLNEVYDSLGIPRTRAGAVVGWVLKGNGDGHIDFGFWDPKNDRARDFVNGREGSILLDFNVDGVIWDKIDDDGERLQWQR